MELRAVAADANQGAGAVTVAILVQLKVRVVLPEAFVATTENACEPTATDE